MNDQQISVIPPSKDVGLAIIAIITGLVFLAIAVYGAYSWWLVTEDFDVIVMAAIVVWTLIAGLVIACLWCIRRGLKDIFF